ncbi:hypothetical protein WV31_10200 [Magnetospirillum sp. ME-1]|uniref:hypothetical protein n=1 Tax=Magnetospirillum sp. ME-1 TaxID=1639348 RepID=UPI000A179AFB|nr:hypothetical protein [Magnetospirillum sp. ME-1]ARJ65997.1 hypothetical protein WV31_10200 [Magnetospirillum sp. ME-1]
MDTANPAATAAIDRAKWIGTATGIAGAVMLAAHIPCSDWGFLFHLASSASWTFAGLRARDASIWLLNGAFLAINILAIARWTHLV